MRPTTKPSDGPGPNPGRLSNIDRAEAILNAPAVDKLLEDVVNLNKLGLQAGPANSMSTDDVSALQPTPTPVSSSMIHRTTPGAWPETVSSESISENQRFFNETAEITGIRAFITKDSGERVEFESGMVRDVGTGKPRYDLIPLGPLTRLAELYARGAEKYGEDNWKLGNGPDEMKRAKSSALRHLLQAIHGETDEDHYAAAVWNIFAILFGEAK